MSVAIYPPPAELAIATADLVATYLNDVGRPATLGLAGGSTPAATYEQLVSRGIDWSQVTMWLGDERWVPHDHTESNTRMVRETLVDKVFARFLAPDTAFGEPAAAALAYGRSLTAAFWEGHPDVVLLGLGDDGHTASLFPDTEALDVEERCYLANWVESKETWRLTASMPMLWSARELVFVVQGEAKSGVLARIIDDGHPYPAQRVAAGATRVRWLIDEAAGSKLRAIPR